MPVANEHPERNRAVTLGDFAQDHRWVAWRTELRTDKQGNKKSTKVPHAASGGGLASSTDPKTWAMRVEAERRWERLRRDAVDGVGGVGIVLGELRDGSHLAGIDLDRCLNPKTDEPYPWAKEIIERFPTYAEVSPSGKGVKAFFIVAAGDVAEVKMMLGRQLGKAFKADAHKGIEFYLGGRYFAVTDDSWDDVKTLHSVAVDDVRWLLQEAGPEFLAKFKKQTAPFSASGPKDASESGYGFQFMGQRKKAGDTFEQACDAILADQGRAGEWARCAGDRQLQRAWDNQPKANSTEQDTRPLIARSVATFERRELEWLWHPFIPKRMISLLSGDKGSGKSTVLAARISKGRALPRFGDDGEQRAPNGSVIIIGQEDDITSVLRPRLEAAGADLERIHLLGYAVPDDPKELDLIDRLDTTVQKLEGLVKQIGDLQLIVIDPITDYTGKGDLNKDTDVRKLLNPIGRLASRYNLAVINIIHFNKKVDLPARYRMLGSVAFRNLAKSSVIAVKSADASNLFYMAQEASNLTAEQRAVSYTMHPVGQYHRIDWSGDYEDMNAEELMEDKQPKKKQRAEKLLREWLADGPVDVDELEAKEAGIGWRTMQRAKDDIEAISKKTAKNTWTWALYGDS